VLTAAACGGSSGFRPDGGGGSGGAGGGAGNRLTGTLPTTINRNVDVLFMIDDSSEMRLAQTNLINNFPTFMTTLQSAPQGLPNLHLAVVSQDMGAGDGSISGCDALGGKKGIFQYTPRGTCAATHLQAGATYISNIAGAANYTGDIADVFACIAALGEAGCGFEHQFAAILRALGADNQGAAPAENQGFLRPEAYLVIVMLTNEDDCSAAPGVPLYDTRSNTNIASQLGPPANFRCNEFGHTCPTGVSEDIIRTVPHPDRNAPNHDVTQAITYEGCTSDDTEGYLLGVKYTADQIKALKTDPSMVSVVSLSGPPTPYTVRWMNPSAADSSCGAASCPWPVIGHSCNANDGSFADPGVRDIQLANEFGTNSLPLSICDASFAPALQRIGLLVNTLVQPPCIPGPIGLDPATGGPDCKITMTSGGSTKTLPACADDGGVPPCWQLVQGNCNGNGFALQVSPDPNLPASAAATISYSCGTCVAGMPDPARGCP
jgi:hypothetical protein